MAKGADILKPIREIQENMGDKNIALTEEQIRTRFALVKASFAEKYKAYPQKVAVISKRLEDDEKIWIKDIKELQAGNDQKREGIKEQSGLRLDSLMADIEEIDADRATKVREALMWGDLATDADRKTTKVGNSTVGVIDDYEGFTSDNNTEARKMLAGYVSALQYESEETAADVMNQAHKAYEADEGGNILPGDRMNESAVQRLTNFGKYESVLKDFKLNVGDKAFLTGMMDIAFKNLKNEQPFQYQAYLAATLKKYLIDKDYKPQPNAPEGARLFVHIQSPTEWLADQQPEATKAPEAVVNTPLATPPAVDNGAPVVAPPSSPVAPLPAVLAAPDVPKQPAAAPDLGPIPPPIEVKPDAQKNTEVPAAPKSGMLDNEIFPVSEGAKKEIQEGIKKFTDKIDRIMEKPNWQVGEVYNVFFDAINQLSSLKFSSNEKGDVITIDPPGKQKLTLSIEQPKTREQMMAMVAQFKELGNDLTAGNPKKIKTDFAKFMANFMPDGTEQAILDATDKAPKMAAEPLLPNKEVAAEMQKAFEPAYQMMEQPDWTVGKVYNLLFERLNKVSTTKFASNERGDVITIDPEGEQKFTLKIDQPQSKAEVKAILDQLKLITADIATGDKQKLHADFTGLIMKFAAGGEDDEPALPILTKYVGEGAPPELPDRPGALITHEQIANMREVLGTPISDVYTRAWRTEGRPGRNLLHPEWQGHDCRALTGEMNLRDTQSGLVVEKLNSDNYVQVLPNQKTLEVKGVNFILAQYAHPGGVPRLYYVREDDLQLVEAKKVTFGNEKPRDFGNQSEHFEVKGPYAEKMKAILSQIDREHENPNGVTFNLPFNGTEVACVLRKVGNNWEIRWGANDLFVNFQTLSDAEKFLSEGMVQYDMMWLVLRDKNQFLPYEAHIGEVEDHEYVFNDKRNFHEVEMELDWKDTSIFGGGNPKVHMTAAEWGVITYRIDDRDHVGQNGEDHIEGRASNFPMFMQTVAEIKAHAEKLDEET